MPFTDTSDTRIVWEERGAGDPLLLIMGASMTREMWHRTVPALAQHHRVIWYDNRGFGESAPTTAPYTVPDMVGDALAVLDAAEVDAAHVYGISMGGLQAQELALTHPERVTSLILGCTWAAAPDRRRASWGVGARLRVPPRMQLAMAKPALYGPKRNKQLVAEDWQILRKNPPNGNEARAQLRAGLRYASRDRLPNLRIPTLVLHGDHDRVIPYAWGQELAALVPHAQLITFEGAGHNYLTDCGDEANAAVLAFLQSVPGPTGTTG